MKTKQIKLSEYNKDFPEDIKKWIGNPEIPKKLKENLKKLPDHVSLFDLLMRIRKKLQETYGFKKSSRNAKSFEESRFSSIEEMLNNKLHSCGSVTAIYGNAIRSRNIPVKLIHGKLPDQKMKIGMLG